MVPIEGKGQHNPVRGKGLYFVQATEEWKVMEIVHDEIGTIHSTISPGHYRGRPAVKPSKVSWLPVGKTSSYSKDRAQQSLCMLHSEEHRKAVCGKIACTV